MKRYVLCLKITNFLPITYCNRKITLWIKNVPVAEADSFLHQPVQLVSLEPSQVAVSILQNQAGQPLSKQQELMWQLCRLQVAGSILQYQAGQPLSKQQELMWQLCRLQVAGSILQYQAGQPLHRQQVFMWQLCRLNLPRYLLSLFVRTRLASPFLDSQCQFADWTNPGNCLHNSVPDWTAPP